MWFALDGDQVVLWTYAASQKARNVEGDSRATLLAETGESYDQLRGVSLDCDVEVVREPTVVLELGRLLQRRNSGGAPGGDALIRAQATKRVGLRLTVVRTRSWDHRKLRMPR